MDGTPHQLDILVDLEARHDDLRADWKSWINEWRRCWPSGSLPENPIPPWFRTPRNPRFPTSAKKSVRPKAAARRLSA